MYHKIMKQTINQGFIYLFVTYALKYEFKLHQRSGIQKRRKTSETVFVRPLPDSYISTQIRDLCNGFKWYLKQIRIAWTYVSCY